MERIVVTRHPALVELLIERGIISPNTPVIPHATEDDVRNKHVVGILPLHLAALAAFVTEVPLDLAPGDRGHELGIERLREVACREVTYTVTRHESASALDDRAYVAAALAHYAFFG